MRTFWVGHWLVKPALNRIERGEETRHLEPRVMDLLVYLAGQAGEVITRDRLIQAVWPESFVTDNALSYSITQLRQLLGDDAREPRFIETIQRRGYRLIAEVIFEDAVDEPSRYELLEKLGQGGMGEVHLARDTILNRRVALKFLRPENEADELWTRRLMREARAAAALDHPYICKVYETGQLDGRDFIAMEYVEGEKLSRRIEQGPLPLEEALRIGLEIAEALECAHTHGIVHRDIKPSNVILTGQGHVKITDFGIAKRFRKEEGEQEEGTLTDTAHASPGTPDYMSPEQIRGEPLDQRSDLFQFGMVLYEALAGVHPFRRSTKPETSAAILNEQPRPLSEFRAATPELPPLQHLVGKLLAKETAERYQLAHEVLTDLNRLQEDSLSVAPVRREARRRTPIWVWLLVLSVVSVVTVAVWELWLRPRADSTPGLLMRSSILLPEGERLASGSTYRHAVAISPDGRWVAFTSYRPGDGDDPDGDPVINLRRLDQTDVRRIPGVNPFFSPDSRQLGFVEPSSVTRFHLKRTPVEGGRVELVTDFEDPSGLGGYGCTWLPDGRIVFSPRENSGLAVVPAVGGEASLLTQLDAEGGECSHRLPSATQDGRTVLYTAVRFDLVPDWSRARVMALRLETGESRVLVEGGSDGRSSPSGHLLFAREGRLMAVRFDPGRLAVRGEPVPMWSSLVHSVHRGNSFRETGAAQYGVSRNGLAVFAPGSVCPERSTTPVWVDQKGDEEPLAVEAKAWCSVRIAPDRRGALLTTIYPPSAVWYYDFERNTLRRQTYEGRVAFAVWGPAAEEFTYDCDAEGPRAIYVKSIDSGPGLGEKLAAEVSDQHLESSWSPDGRRLALVVYSDVSSYDIWILNRSEGEVKPWLQTRFGERYPEFSPDGRWLAYTSDASGTREVYVRPFPEPGRPVQISTAGGEEPCWSKEGSEIVYSLWDQARGPILFRRPSNRWNYYAVTVRRDGDELHPGLPELLFPGPYGFAAPVRHFDVAPDGRFLLIKADPDYRDRIQEAMAPTRIELVQNWFQELRARVPVD